MSAPRIIRPGDGTDMTGPLGGPLTFLLRGDDTDGQALVLLNTPSPGEGPPLHLHPAEAEYWYVLEGRFRFRVGDEVHHAERGSLVYVPAGTPHCYQNVGDQPATILIWFTPSGMEAFYERMATLPADARSADDFAWAAEPTGMVVLGPPLSESHPLSHD